jgi:hypothetical protein
MHWTSGDGTGALAAMTSMSYDGNGDVLSQRSAVWDGGHDGPPTAGPVVRDFVSKLHWKH